MQWHLRKRSGILLWYIENSWIFRGRRISRRHEKPEKTSRQLMTEGTLGAELLHWVVVRPEDLPEELAEESAEEVQEEEWRVFMEAQAEILHAEEVVQGAVELEHSHMRVAAWPVPPADEQEEEVQAGVISSVGLVEEWKTI
jgi:hypothetical protein